MDSGKERPAIKTRTAERGGWLPTRHVNVTAKQCCGSTTMSSPLFPTYLSLLATRALSLLDSRQGPSRPLRITHIFSERGEFDIGATAVFSRDCLTRQGDEVGGGR